MEGEKFPETKELPELRFRGTVASLIVNRRDRSGEEEVSPRWPSHRTLGRFS